MKKDKGSIKEFLVVSLNGMAYGLFATLIIGTIFGTLGYLISLTGDNQVANLIVSILGKNGSQSGLSYLLQILTGAGIGIGIALSLRLESLHTIVLGIIGEIAAYFSLSTRFITNSNHPVANHLQIGDPLTIFIVCIFVVLIFKYVFNKKTSLDILIIPLLGTLIGLVLSLLLRYPAIYVTYGIQYLINSGTEATPIIMGIIVSVMMGMALTAPISSAAIATMIFTINGSLEYETLLNSSYKGLALASGAAVVGCCTQMIGFVIQSRKDNNIGTLISIGVGTSMLQFKNIVKKPVIWLPTIISSAILGPISTTLLKTVCMGSSAGMGTAGFIGILGTITSMGVSNWRTWVSILILEIVGPAFFVLIFDTIFRKFKLIKKDDFKI